MADRARVADRGFTLTETIVVILMIGVLASVMVAVVAVIVRNVPTTEARVDDSHTYQRLLLWLPRDAASTPPGQFETVGPWASPSCAGATGGYLVRMSWPGVSGSAVAEYRTVPDADGVRVQRLTCSSGAGYSDTAIKEVTSRIHGAVATPLPPTGTIVGVRLTLTTCQPSVCTVGDETISVAGGSHNPSKVLPTTTTTSTTTTTTTTTTMPAPGP